MNELMIEKITRMKLPYQAEHVGLKLLGYTGSNIESLKEHYFQVLKDENLLYFLDHNLKYASKLISCSDLLGEEIVKIWDLLENIKKLKILELPFDRELYEKVVREFGARMREDSTFRGVVNDLNQA